MRKRQWATIVTGLALLLIGVTDATATVYFIHADHLGTPQAVTDSSGVVKWRADIDPFGEATITTSTLPSNLSMNLRFPGQYYDSETGLHDNHFRTYDPVAGRYLQSDPIGLEGGINTYAYANNNPLTYTDPEGTFGLIGAGIGVGVEIAVQLASNGGRVECIDIADVIIAGVVGAVAPGFLTSGRAVLRSGRAIRALRAQSAMTANRRAKIASRIANNVDSAAVAVSTQAVFQGGKAVAKSELNGPEPDKCEKRCGE